MLLEGRIEAKRVEFGEIRSSFDTLRHGNAVPSLLNLRCQFHILFNPRSLAFQTIVRQMGDSLSFL